MQLSPGQSAHVRGYTLTYLGREIERSAQKTTIKARIRVGGIGELAPAISTYPTFADGIGTPSIHTDPLHDVYLTLISAPTSDRITLGVQVGTLVMWLWIGGLIMAFGTIVALVPQRRRGHRRDARLRTSREPELVEVAHLMPFRARWIAIGVGVVLVAFGVLLAVQHRRRRRCRGSCRSTARCPRSRSPRSTARPSTPRRCATRPSS